MLVNEALRVLHLSPRAGRFLLPSAGPFSPELPALVRPELRVDLQTGLARAFEKNEASLSLPAMVDFDGTARRVILHVAPTKQDDHRPAQALVFFLDGGSAESLGKFEAAARASAPARCGGSRRSCGFRSSG